MSLSYHLRQVSNWLGTIRVSSLTQRGSKKGHFCGFLSFWSEPFRAERETMRNLSKMANLEWSI